MTFNNLIGRTNYSCTWIISKFKFFTEKTIQSVPFFTMDLGKATWRLSAELRDPGSVKEVLCYLQRLSGDVDLFVDVHVKVHERSVRKCFENMFRFKLMEIERVHLVTIPISKEPTIDPDLTELVFECVLVLGKEHFHTSVFEIDSRLEMDSDSRFLKEGSYDIAFKIEVEKSEVHKAMLMARLKKLTEKSDLRSSINSCCLRKIPNISTAALSTLLNCACTGSVSTPDHLCLKEIHRISEEHELRNLHCQLHSWTVSRVLKTTPNNKNITFIWKIGEILTNGSWISKRVPVDKELGGLLQLSCRTKIGFKGLLYLHVWFNFPYLKDRHVYMFGRFGLVEVTCPLDKFTSLNYLFQSPEVKTTCLRVPEYILKRDDGCRHELTIDVELYYGPFATVIINRDVSVGSLLPGKNVHKLGDNFDSYDSRLSSDVDVLTKKHTYSVHKCMLSSKILDH